MPVEEIAGPNGGRPAPADRQADREARRLAFVRERDRRHADACKVTPALMGDLLAFAARAPDAARAAGRYDVVAELIGWQRAS